MDSPRKQLIDAFVACLQRIRVVDGYRTNAGMYVRREPGQVDESREALIAPLISKQERAVDPSVMRTHRLTTASVIVKVPTNLDDVENRLDAILDDAETAMADQSFRFPVGISVPKYISMERIRPEAGMGWVGAVLTYQSNIPIYYKN